MIARLAAIGAAGLALGLAFPSPAANPPPGFRATVSHTDAAPRSDVRVHRPIVLLRGDR